MTTRRTKRPLTHQRSHEPTRKTTAGAISGGTATALMTVLDWVARDFAHVEIPAAVSAAIVLLATVGATYFTRERAS